MEAKLLVKTKCILAESPLWHDQRNSILWVDIEGRTLYAHHLATGQTTASPLPSRVGFIVPDHQGNLILGLQNGVAFYDLDREKLSWLKDVEKEMPENRCNDGKCDSEGRLWFGTMDVNAKTGAGSLYLLDSDLNLQKKADSLSIPNGTAWSLDGKYFYHIDSTRKSVVRYRYHTHTGEIAGSKTVISIPEGMGLPDGMTIDEEGMLWIAHYGGFGVYRWNPENGALLNKITLPVPNVTSCTFGGPHLDTLFITTASEGMDEKARKAYPLSGSIFTAKPGAKGLKANIFNYKERNGR